MKNFLTGCLVSALIMGPFSGWAGWTIRAKVDPLIDAIEKKENVEGAIAKFLRLSK